MGADSVPRSVEIRTYDSVGDRDEKTNINKRWGVTTDIVHAGGKSRSQVRTEEDRDEGGGINLIPYRTQNTTNSPYR